MFELDALIVAVVGKVRDGVGEHVVVLGVIDEPDTGEFQAGGVVENADLNAGAIQVIVALPQHVRTTARAKAVTAVLEFVPAEKVVRIIDGQIGCDTPARCNEVPGRPAAVLAMTMQDRTHRAVDYEAHPTTQTAAGGVQRCPPRNIALRASKDSMQRPAPWTTHSRGVSTMLTSTLVSSARRTSRPRSMPPPPTR